MIFLRPIVAVGVLLLMPLLAHAGEPERKQSRFDSGGVQIAYTEAGQGTPVLLVHGLYSSAKMNWEMPGTFALLAAKYHVIAPDLRGHGQSDKPVAEADYGTPMEEDLVHLLDHLKIAKAHVVGYSLGGIVALKLTVDHPERVLSLTLGGMGQLREGSVFQRAFERMSGHAGSTPPACVHGIAKLAVSDAEVDAVKTPVAIFIGERDPCRRMYVEPLHQHRADWPITEIPQAGHLNCILKEEFKNGILAWLAKQPLAN